MSVAAVFLSDAAARLRASVVGIVAASRVSRRGGPSRGSGWGAGIAWGSDDLFVTSAHVVSAKAAIVVTPDGRAVEGAVVGRDAARDIAVVHASTAAVPRVTTSDPYALRPGSLVFAVGHPLGVKEAVSIGVFQAVGALPRGYGLNGKSGLVWVQADVRLAPGNSGGPIADVEGNVIGVSTMVVSGLALAVPVSEVERFVSRLG